MDQGFIWGYYNYFACFFNIAIIIHNAAFVEMLFLCTQVTSLFCWFYLLVCSCTSAFSDLLQNEHDSIYLYRCECCSFSEHVKCDVVFYLVGHNIKSIGFYLKVTSYKIESPCKRNLWSFIPLCNKPRGILWSYFIR
jgi:hypothetical protein